MKWVSKNERLWSIMIHQHRLIHGHHHSPQDLAALEHQRGIPSLPENGVPLFGGPPVSAGTTRISRNLWLKSFVFVSGSWMRKHLRGGDMYVSIFPVHHLLIYIYIHILYMCPLHDTSLHIAKTIETKSSLHQLQVSRILLFYLFGGYPTSHEAT